MVNVFLHLNWRAFAAINLIAAQAVITVALAQNSIENPATQPPAAEAAQRAAEDTERQRITRLRAAANTEFEAAKQACYQKFVVNSCIAKARAKLRSEVTDLKRQEVALNDADRKRRGAQQLQNTEAKTSPEAQAQIAQQRDSAAAATAQREENQAGKAAVQQSAAQTAQTRSTSMQRRQADAAKATAQHKTDAAAKAAQSKARYDARIKEAQEKRANMLAKKPSKPPAAGLPIPPTAP